MDGDGRAERTRAMPPDGSTALRRPGGEFRSRALEASFAAEHQPETHRHARTLLIAAAILNTLLFASDWRFHGTPHFWVVITARAIAVAAASAGIAMLNAWPGAAARERVMAGWMIVTAAAVAVLTNSHSEIALFVVIMLPMIYYLAVPVRFAWTLAGGIGCSVALLAGYGYGEVDSDISLGLILAMLILNVSLAMVVSRANRLQRLEWLATRAERRTSAELAASREQVEKLFAASPVPMVVSRRVDGSVVRINDSAIEFIGASPGSDVATVADFYVDREDRARLLALIDRDGGVREFEMPIRLADGSIRTVLIKANTVDLADGLMIMSGIIDISDRKAVENELERLATTDPLTRLPNRLSFFATGRAEMSRAARLGTPLALLMIDIDHFKLINDSFGHQIGDQALRGFADACRAVLGDQGIAARLGGEEFGVLMRGADLAAAQRLAERLRHTIETLTFERAGETLRMTASIGVAMIDPRDRDLDRALARADAALYAAKHGGRNRVVAEGAGVVRRAG